MTSYILPSVMQSLFRDQLSRLFALFWNIPGHLLIKIDRNIISSLHIVFSLCARVAGVMSVQIFCRCKCKRGVTVEYLTRATFEKQLTAFHVVLIIIFLSSVCLFCWQKCGPRPKLFLRLDIFSTLVDHIMLTYLRKSFTPDNKIKWTCERWYLNLSLAKHKRLHKISFSRHRKHTQNRP